MLPLGAWLLDRTVITRVAGVGSDRPSASVTTNVTVNVPALLNVIAPGSFSVESGIPDPDPKLHRYPRGRLLSGSVPVPVKVTEFPALIV